MKAYIKAISYYLPEKELSNADLEKLFPEWNAEKVAAKIGVNKRHIAASDETAGDMAEKAALCLFDEFKINPDDIDFIMLCTQSPDYFLPTTACILQHRLGLSTAAGALDFNQGCSGSIYGMAMAKGLICSGIAKNILFITAETYSKYIHPEDKGNRAIFGDGAAACLISTDGIAEIGEFVLGTDGKGADQLIVKAGCARLPKKTNETQRDDEKHIMSSDYLYMNGSEIFSFTLETVPDLVQGVYDKNRMSLNDVDYFIFHQANKFMLDTMRKVCVIPKNKFYNNLENTGNTVSSTVLIGLKECILNKNIRQGMNVMLVGFGVGYSWGGTILKFC